ncbi:MAG: O-antigen ligase family protein, partial [Patescibacteria group bacterium]
MRRTPFEQFFLWIVKIGLWTIPFLPLYVSASMLFPFITGKNFAFRIIIEIIFALWAGLAAYKEEYRPRLTPLFKIVTVFVAVVFLADLFSPNPYRAFFSNYERMEGFMMIFHLYLYFVMLVSVFRARDWIIFFHATLLASLAVSYIGLMQKLGYRVSLQGGFRVDSTIGNPAYLAAYLLFHIWLLLILMYRFWKKWWLVGLYGSALLFELVILYFTASRGPVLALVIILVPFIASIVWFWPRIVEERIRTASGIAPKADAVAGFGPYSGWSLGRKVAGVILVLVVAVPLFFWQIRGSDFVQSNQVLSRLVNYSLTETTVKSRFNIWGMSARAALERPILGWGQENYYLVFQKYFDPALFAQEPWFDRSHNIIFDWLIHAGFPGIASYLGMILVACWVIVRGIRKGSFPVWYGIVLAALFLTYLLQNLFVFDNLNTYLLFFAFLAFTEFFAHASAIAAPPATNARRVETRSDLGRGIAVGVTMILVVVGLLYPLHIKPIFESKALIRALNLPSQEGATLSQVESAFREALAYRSFGDTEVREQLSNMARGVINSSSIPAEARNAFLAFTVDELKKEAAEPAKDVKHLLFLGTILTAWAASDPGRAAEAEAALREAVRLSPTKQIMYFPLAQLYLSTGRGEDAMKVLKTAWELDKNYHEA